MNFEGEKALAERILGIVKEHGIHFERWQAETCLIHILLMREWNRRLNLSRIESIEEILVQHLLDSLIPAHWLPKEGYALDLGSGAGFPGIPIKILHTDLKMVLLEKVRKKVSFLKVVVANMPLQEIFALNGRWEEFFTLPSSLTQQKYALITMRALRLQAEQLTSLALPLLQVGGVFAWWAGSGADISALPNEFRSELGSIVFRGCYPYDLPKLSNPRQLCIWEKRKGRQKRLT